MDELVEIEATAEGTIVEWLDEWTFRSSQVAADPLCPAGATVR